MKTQLVVTLMCGMMSLNATGQTPRRLAIQSRSDRYELLLNGNSGTVAGQPANPEAIKNLLALLNTPLADSCPSLNGPADVSISENGQTRAIFVSRGVIREGKLCASVSGDGLVYLPTHREFLIGAPEGTISVRSPLKVFRQNAKVIDLHKEGDIWYSDSKALLDWDFLELFENSLKSFKIRFRVQSILAKDKPKITVQSGAQTFEFYKITNVLWAMKKPGQDWLEASDDWSFWYGLEDNLLDDRYTAQIQALSDRSKSKAEHLATLQSLDGKYSRNLHELYRRLVLGVDEDAQIKSIAIQRLRMKPTLETALGLAKYLQVGDDEEIKKIVSQILKTNEPKGPLYKPGDRTGQNAKTVQFWMDWSSQRRRNP